MSPTSCHCSTPHRLTAQAVTHPACDRRQIIARGVAKVNTKRKLIQGFHKKGLACVIKAKARSSFALNKRLAFARF
jgi:hypothetical protein